MPGLDPAGVPKSLKNTAIPFNYNNLDSTINLHQEMKEKHSKLN